MNKLTLAINVWRAYTAARRTEGSSLVGKILVGISVLAIIVISLLSGNLTAEDVGTIVTSITGLAGALFYLIPDRLGAVTLTAERGETNGALSSPIELVGQSQAGWADAESSDGRSRPCPVADQLRQPVPSGGRSDPAQPMADNFPGWNG